MNLDSLNALKVRKIQLTNLPIKPGALDRRLQLVIKVMTTNYPNFKDVHQMRLKQHVREFTVKLHARFCLKTKQAPPLSWPDARRLARLLWNATIEHPREHSTLLRKAAALALMLGTATGARWGDLHRLRWEDITKVTTCYSQNINRQLTISL